LKNHFQQFHHLTSPSSNDEFGQHTKDNSVIRYGASIVKSDQGKKVGIAEVILHEMYRDQYVFYKYDIALLKTKEPMALKGEFAMALSLPKQGVDHPPGTKCDLASYGKTGQDSVDSEPRQLRYTWIAPLDDVICQDYIPLVLGLFCGYRPKAGVCEVSLLWVDF
jgi:Trypsin